MRIIVRFTTLIMLLSLTLGVTTAQEDGCQVEPEIMTTPDDVEFVRTPDACFDNLPDWDYEAQYVEIDGLRQAYVDVGTGESGETILLLHGQPSWSYLYRKMIPVLAADGHRVIAMDHVGMGRSDKPVDPDYYTYIGHVERLETFIQELELEQGSLTAFVQDWGSLIGLQVVGTNPDWFDRVVVGNGFLPTFPEGTSPFTLPGNPEITRNLFHQSITNAPEQQEPLVRDPSTNIESQNAQYSTSFGLWVDYALNDERFRPEVIVEALTYYNLSDAEVAAYAAPFPSRITMSGPRVFPGLISELQGVSDTGWAGLGEFNKPFLTIWGDNDSGYSGQPFVQQQIIDHIPGSDGWNHVRLEEAGHFLQDDQGEEIARRVSEFIAQTSSSISAREETVSDATIAPTVYMSEQYETQVTTHVYAQGLTHDEWGSESAEPMDLLLDVYEPIGAPPDRPAMIIIHGGAFRLGSRDDGRFVNMAEYYATRGWVTLSIDYRLSGDHGTIPQSWQEGIEEHTEGGDTVTAIYPASRDAKAAVRWLYANAETYQIDTDYISTLGMSAGASLAIMLGTTDEHLYRDELTLEEDPTLASTNLDQPADVHTVIALSMTPAANTVLERIYDINTYDETDAPLMMMNGTNDRLAPYEEAEMLREQYDATGAPYAFYAIEGAGHTLGMMGAEVDGRGIFDLGFDFIVEQQELQTEE